MPQPVDHFPAKVLQGRLQDQSTPGLKLLLTAQRRARVVPCERWQFAVEGWLLSAAGLVYEELEWLVERGLVACQVALPGTAAVTLVYERCRFVLTVEGERFVERTCAEHSARDPQGNAHPKPFWDNQRRELWWQGRLVKRLRQPGTNQEHVLRTFEELGWPPAIDNPLPPRDECDPQQRLHDTIKRLNGRQCHTLVHFRGDGRGQGVEWRPREGTAE